MFAAYSYLGVNSYLTQWTCAGICGAVEGNLHLGGEKIVQPEECWCFPPGSECHPLLAA